MTEPRPPYQEMSPRAPEGEFDLSTQVPGAGPLELDVGFGRGMSLFTRAEVAPASRIIGIEIKAKWATKVEARRKRRGLSQMRIYAGDARDILSRARPDACVQRVSVHFPDPWWKKRHAKRLLVADVFLVEVARLLAPGGELYVQTDVDERAEAYVRLIGRHDAFALAGDGGYVADNPFGAISNRERRAEEDGLPIYRVLAHRR